RSRTGVTASRASREVVASASRVRRGRRERIVHTFTTRPSACLLRRRRDASVWPVPPDVQPAWMRYGYGVVAVACALGAALLLRSFDLEGFLFVIAVAATVWLGGRGPGIVAVVLSIVVIDYFFLGSL